MGNIPPSILRQPPPPLHHRRSPMAGDKEAHTEMVVGNCVSVEGRTRPFYDRRCKRKRLTTIQSLPDELVFEILMRLPAQYIYDSARLVCRKWYHMIHTHDFIYAHLQHTNYGILFQCPGVDRHNMFVAMRQGQIEISRFKYKFSSLFRTSCNGLLLGCQIRKSRMLIIANPTTKQNFILPPSFCDIHRKELCGIGYVAASMEYKVVLKYRTEMSEVLQCAILTVGVDESWRNVRTEHLSLTAMKLLVTAPLITEGFMHWAMDGTQVLTLDLESEIIRETPPPISQVYFEEKYGKHYMSTGSYLSLLIACGKFLWEVWEMKPETGEWRKLPNIVLKAQECIFEQYGYGHDQYFIPVGWLKYREVLVLGISCPGRAFVVYHLLTQEIDFIESPPYSKSYNVVTHKNSLVWLGGC